ncbi:histidine kinase [Bosea sp. (in: a-proteobacteria)]|uniref:histidine kinase n=1 Tax=Bosea sp. (in: a-proteobacteria) TaxID=1871050 RepID=UPI002736A77B|nr:histidine kinase [Bosea sp. (in: a-proteobacteria)]MDP3407889.1 histidine kinase [Bosea sp. (in: a-proteobacteria)]
MADFYPILARAVAGLPDTSPAARHAIYDRARAALVAQLRSLDPPLGEAEIMRERLSLDEAVARIEADYDDTPLPFDVDALPPALPPETDALPQAGVEPQPAPEDERFEEPRPEIAEPQPVRPRVSPPREKRVKPVHLRTAVVATGIAIAVAAIAAAAYYVNKVNPPDAASRPRAESPSQPAQADNAGKINERVGEAGTPAPVVRPGGNASASAPSQEIAVAQRAILYTEDAATPQTPRAVNGRVFWRLDSESVGQGRPVETIVRATVEVAEMGLSLDFTIRRNTDTAFPASHIIGMRFTSTGPAATDAVREVGVPQFKTEESERGAPLSAINSALGENLFVAALSNVPVEVERNVELILNRAWIDVPVRFASGKRGILTFEKGVSGSQTLADAFGRWR